MSRQWTKGPQGSGDIILVQPQNEEINQAAAEINGGLDQNNLPLDSIGRVRIIQPVTTTVASPQQTSIVYASQAYYFSEESSNVATIGEDEWTLGWNKFEVLQGAQSVNGFFLNFQSKEGMLKGEVCIDLSVRESFLAVSTVSIPIPEYRIQDKHRGELGVFVNDVLVARTGAVWFSCGRNTYVVPYGCAIGSGPCHVDVRWQQYWENETRNLANEIVLGAGRIDEVASIVVRNRLTWCRNEYR